MDRMGHSTTRATLIYIHKTAGRDKKIADALSDLVEREREQKNKGTENPEGHAEGTPQD